MKTKIVNLTPHEIVLYSEDKTTILAKYPPSGSVARVKEETKKCILASEMYNIPIAIKEYSKIENLPPFKYAIEEKDGKKVFDLSPDTIYLVSAMVLAATNSSDNPHILAPDTGSGAVRDESGKIIGTTRFIENPIS